MGNEFVKVCAEFGSPEEGEFMKGNPKESGYLVVECGTGSVRKESTITLFARAAEVHSRRQGRICLDSD
jgi:hypothetical protein